MLSLNGVAPKKSVLAQVRRLICLLPLLGMIGCGVTESKPAPAAVGLTASPTSIAPGTSSMLTAQATDASQVVITGSDGSRYTLSGTGGTQSVTPTATTTYTATATGANGDGTSVVTVTVLPNPPTVTLSAAPTSVTAGGSSTLTATATNAIQVLISGTDGSHYLLSTTGGAQSVSPTATTTYTATATGASGATVTATAMVTVTSSPATVTLSALPTSIAPGGTSTLTAAATNATQVVISGTDGSHYTLSATGGTQVVTPTATTTYTATATGSGGNATANATVTVTASAPVVTFNASPTSVAPGGSSLLTASATNSTQVVISGTDGSHYTLSTTGGTQSVTPAATTTYTATATGPGGSTSANATVTISATAPTVTLRANPPLVTAGSASVLTASATNATQVVISGTDGSHYTLSSTGGTQSVTPSSTTTYTVTATGAGGSNSASAIVTVTASAPAVTLNANPTSITSGNSSTLTASATNATQVTISGTDGSNYTLAAGGGMQSVTPTATTTYTATAKGPGGMTSANATVTVSAAAATVTLSASPTSIASGSSSTLTATATNATQVTISGTDGSSYTLGATGGTQLVSPTATTTYTATAISAGGNATNTATVTVVAAGSLQSINHVIFMLQENHSFDEYFGMLNTYRAANHLNKGDDGKTYSVDGIDDKLTTISNTDDENNSYSLFKLTSTCVEDETSSWLESYGDVSRYDFSLGRSINIDGFVHTAENFAKNCQKNSGTGCAGTFSDFTGRRAMGYYDGDFLNYYYYMASQFALSDRWFSPLSSKSIPNRIATFTGGTTQGLAFDPGDDDNLPQLNIPTILEDLSTNNVTWKIYYTVTQGACLDYDDCIGGPSAQYPATDFSYLQDSYKYLYENPTGADCVAPTQKSGVVGDKTNSFCIDPNHIAPLKTYYDDLTNGSLPSFAFIEPGYGVNDEHPGSGQSIFQGQQQVANIVNALMVSSEWMQSVFFLSYDEGGGPYDHVPPVPGHSNDYTDSTVGSASLSDYPDITSISVNPDTYVPCQPPPGTVDLHCDLASIDDPGAKSGDAPAVQGFRAQLGFRLPNIVISPFTRKHYVSHIPMDHTAILKFVENRFINSSAHLTARDQAQPDLLDFFDFTNAPWTTPPMPPVPMSDTAVGHSTCTPTSIGP